METWVFIVQTVLIRKLKNFSTIRDTDIMVNKWASGIWNCFFFPLVDHSILNLSRFVDFSYKNFSIFSHFSLAGHWTNRFLVLSICNLFRYSKCTFTLFTRVSNLFDAHYLLQPSMYSPFGIRWNENIKRSVLLHFELRHSSLFKFNSCSLLSTENTKNNNEFVPSSSSSRVKLRCFF